MNPGLFTALTLAGGVGAVLRFVVDSSIRAAWPTRFPTGTAVINVSGSFALGLLTGVVEHHLLAGDWLPVIGTGLLGGYTTFSTASVETVRLIQERRWAAAGFNGLGILVLCVAAAWAGVLLGGR